MPRRLSKRDLERIIEKQLDTLSRRLGEGVRDLRLKAQVANERSPFDIYLERPRHPHEGGGLIMEGVRDAIDADGVIGTEAMAFLERHAAMRARVLLRAAALKAAPDTGDEWAFDMHPLALALLRNAGFALGQIVRNAPSHASQSLTLAIENKMAATAGIELQVDMARCAAGAIDIDIHEVHDDDSPSFSLYDSLGDCSLVVHDVHLPETVLPTLAGRPLREVIRHRVIETLPDLRIVEASSHVRGTSLAINPCHVALAPAPTGVDVAWRSLPAITR